jgi:TPR repeat protein
LTNIGRAGLMLISWLILASSCFLDAKVGYAAQTSAPAVSPTNTPSTGPVRRAFILGVQRYSDRSIQQLSRSDTDAADVAADLEQIGFDKKNITLVTDLHAKADFEKRFSAFLATVNEGDTVFFFFSGHGLGVESTGTNYLLLADLKSLYAYTRDQLLPGDQRSDDIIALKMPSFSGAYETEEIPKSGISASDVMHQIAEKKPKVAFIVLDACRSLATPTGDIRSTKRGRDSGSRLVPSQDLGSGFIVLFSASFGEQAVESLGDTDHQRNSLFTEVLRSELQRPGQTLIELSERTKLVVKAFAARGGFQQEPEYFENLGTAANFTLVDSVGAERFPFQQQECQGAQADWDQISIQPDREALERHRKRFHDCATAELARRALVNLINSSEDPTPTISTNKQIDDCDRLAASDSDTSRPPEVPGVTLSRIDFDQAIDACKKSIQRNPRVARFLFNLGRAEQAAANSVRPDDPARKDRIIQARAAFDDAANRGYVAALFSLATLLDYTQGADEAQGQEDNRTQDRATKLLEEAANQGFPPAMYELGLRLKYGSFGKQRDFKLAYDWLAHAAESGSVAAMTEVAEALWYGRGVDPNPRRAFEWAERAAEAGSYRAKYDLGKFYFFGHQVALRNGHTVNSRNEQDVSPASSVSQDYGQALLWFGRAAADNNPDAQYWLAKMMEWGVGLPNPQPEVAEHYFRLAAHGGSEEAEIELAEKLRFGSVLVKPENSRTEAIDLLTRALSQGSARAAWELAQIYRNGELGETKSPLEAMKYSYLAINLSVQADPTTRDGNPFYEAAAGILLAEMATSGEAYDVNNRALLGQEETDRLQRFYGKVDPTTHKVRLRRLDVPLQCGGSTDPESVYVWDWGRSESPTEPQFRSLEYLTTCFYNYILRNTLISSFETAKKNKVAFADLIQQQISAAVAQTGQSQRGTKR